MTMQMRVLIAHDRRPSRSGLRVARAARPGIVIVGEAADGQEPCGWWRRFPGQAIAVQELLGPILDH